MRMAVSILSGPSAKDCFDDEEKNYSGQNAETEGEVGEGVRVTLVVSVVVMIVIVVTMPTRFGRVRQQVKEHVTEHASDGKSDEHPKRAGADIKVEEKHDDGVARDGDKHRAGHGAACHGLGQHGKHAVAGVLGKGRERRGRRVGVGHTIIVIMVVVVIMVVIMVVVVVVVMLTMIVIPVLFLRRHTHLTPHMFMLLVVVPVVTIARRQRRGGDKEAQGEGESSFEHVFCGSFKLRFGKTLTQYIATGQPIHSKLKPHREGQRSTRARTGMRRRDERSIAPPVAVSIVP